MKIARALAACALLATLLFLSSDGVQSQDKKEAKTKGQLPQHFSKLDLTATQRDEVYKLNREYKEKIDKLEDEVKKLREELTRKRLAVLTDEQRKKYLELLGAEPKPSDKDTAKDKAKSGGPDKQ
jgi:Spy/CpxP family protein refolding chaperone